LPTVRWPLDAGGVAGGTGLAPVVPVVVPVVVGVVAVVVGVVEGLELLSLPLQEAASRAISTSGVSRTRLMRPTR
jgi:NAD(P)H-flavin reductase